MKHYMQFQEAEQNLVGFHFTINYEGKITRFKGMSCKGLRKFSKFVNFTHVLWFLLINVVQVNFLLTYVRNEFLISYFPSMSIGCQTTLFIFDINLFALIFQKHRKKLVSCVYKLVVYWSFRNHILLNSKISRFSSYCLNSERYAVNT